MALYSELGSQEGVHMSNNNGYYKYLYCNMIRLLLPISKNLFSKTIFDKILTQEIPSSKVYEDELIYAFNDISPQAPVHVLIIPKQKFALTGISKAQQIHKDILGHILWKAKQIAEIKGINTTGYRLVINEGKGYLKQEIMGSRLLSTCMCICLEEGNQNGLPGDFHVCLQLFI